MPIDDLPPPPASMSQGIADLPPPPPQAAAGDAAPDARAIPASIADLPPPPSDNGYEDVRKTMDRSFWAAPLVGTQATTDKELAAIAAHHGVDPDALKSVATDMGAHLDGDDTDRLREFESAIGRGVGGGIPQLIEKKSVDDPNLRDALDDVRELANSKRSFAQGLAENIIPIGELAKGLGFGVNAAEAGVKAIAKSFARRAIEEAPKAAAIGSVYGLTGSREGQEVQGAVTGAGVGLALGIGTAGIGRVLSHLSGDEKAVVRALPPEEKAVLDSATKEVLESRADSESLIKDQILNPDAGDLTQDQARTIVQQQVPAENRAHMFDAADEGGRMRLEQMGGVEAAEKAEAQGIIERRAMDLAEEVTGDRPESLEEAQKALQASGQGMEQAAKTYDTLAVRNAATDYIQQTSLRLGTEDGAGGKAANMVSDSQFAARVIDERMKAPISAERTLNQLNTNLNRMSWVRKAYDSDLAQIAASNKKAIPAMRDGTITKAIETGTIDQLPQQFQKAAQDIRDHLEKWREFANGKVQEKDSHISPLNITPVENYMPSATIPPNRVGGAIQAQTAKAVEQATQALGRPIESLSDIKPAEFQQLKAVEGPIQELNKAVQMFDAKGSGSGAELQSKLVDNFQTRAATQRLYTVARAAEERTGEIPEFLKEGNAFRLASNWGQNTLNHLYMRQPIEQLAALQKIADKSGAKLESGYIGRLLADVNGIRPGTVAAQMRQFGVSWNSQMTKVIDSNAPGPTKLAAQAGRVLPEILNDLRVQVYPNLIGLNPHSLVQHMTQPFTKLMPELGGGKYGATLVFRSLAHVLLNLRSELEKAKAEGYYAAHLTPQTENLTADKGLRSSYLYSKALGAATELGKASMFLFSKIYEINKTVARSAGTMLAYDLSRGLPAAEKALRRFPSDIQRAVRYYPDQAASILGHHLADVTMYNYNRPASSEFSRSMGPMFSTFTKWPMATAGDIMADYRTKSMSAATLATFRKYWAPMAALIGTQHLLFGDPDQMSDVQKKILGSSGLGGMAPFGSIAELRDRGFGMPPMVDTMIKAFVVPTIKGIQTKDPEVAMEGLRNGFSNVVQQYAPGSVLVRFITDDLPTYLDHRPQGDNFIERTQNGARQMLK